MGLLIDQFRFNPKRNCCLLHFKALEEEEGNIKQEATFALLPILH